MQDGLSTVLLYLVKVWFGLQDGEIQGLWCYGGLGPGRPHRRFWREVRAGALGGEQVPANVKYGQGPWSLEQRPREVGRTGLGIRNERPTWGSTVQGFLGMRRMADWPWGFVALS